MLPGGGVPANVQSVFSCMMCTSFHPLTAVIGGAVRGGRRPPAGGRLAVNRAHSTANDHSCDQHMQRLMARRSLEAMVVANAVVFAAGCLGSCRLLGKLEGTSMLLALWVQWVVVVRGSHASRGPSSPHTCGHESTPHSACAPTVPQ
jgi:hypothetical protein